MRQKTVREQIDAMRHNLDLLADALDDSDMDAIADDAPIQDPLNYRGHIGDNFYNTIQHLLSRQLIGIGQYDMPNGIIIALTDEIGLQILPDYNRYTGGDKMGLPVTDEDFSVHLDLRFVKLPDDNWLGDPVIRPEAWVSGWTEIENRKWREKQDNAD